MTNQAFICDAIRTPFGRYGGALSSVRADDLGAVPLRALMERNPGVDWQAVTDVIYGCANQAGDDNRNVARMASLLAGLPLGRAGKPEEIADLAVFCASERGGYLSGVTLDVDGAEREIDLEAARDLMKMGRGGGDLLERKTACPGSAHGGE